jgi:hypothetical protein
MMKVLILITLLAGLLVASAATALALADQSGGTAADSVAGQAVPGPRMQPDQPGSVQPAVHTAIGPVAQPLAQSALAIVNGLEIQDPNPTCGRPFTVHVNVANQSGSVSLPGTVTLQDVHRGSGNVDFTSFQNFPSMQPGGNFVVVFEVLINTYISRGHELTAFTNGSSFSTKYDLAQGSCSKSSSSSPSPSPDYSLQVRHSGKCLDVPGGSRNSVTTVQQFSCTGGVNQEWALESVGNGFFRIVSKFSGMCLDVKGFSQEAQAPVQQFPCNGGDNQSFRFQHVSGDYNLIVARHSGQCLDVRGASTADLAPIQQFPCHENRNQQWRLR